jgi:hypothetical protein
VLTTTPDPKSSGRFPSAGPVLAAGPADVLLPGNRYGEIMWPPTREPYLVPLMSTLRPFGVFELVRPPVRWDPVKDRPA